MLIADTDIQDDIVIEAVDDHPCFSKEASRTAGRIHLPVAPACNVQCNFCNRKYDCVAESRPGVTAKVLTPEAALARLEFVLSKRSDITVVGIAGPGDPLANPEETLRTMELVRIAHPDMKLCISTNGFLLEDHIDELIDEGLSHLTVTINSFKPEIIEKIYSWVNYGGEKKSGREAAVLLIEKQKGALKKLDQCNIPVKINIVLMEGINEHDIPELVDELKEHKSVSCVNIMPFIPVEGSKFEHMPPPDKKLLNALRNELEPKIPQIRHCCQCRSDAIGKVSCGAAGNDPKLLEELAGYELRAAGFGFDDKSRVKVAVASTDGENVNEHFGHAKTFYIYQFNGTDFILEEKRELSPFCCSKEGTHAERLAGVMDILSDCSVILCTKIGDGPKAVMEAAGFNVVEGDGGVLEMLGTLKDNS